MLGIDGGGTHTRAMLADALGNVLGAGTAGPSNMQAVGRANTQAEIELCVRRAWDAAGLPPRPAACAMLGMAGVASEDDRQAMAALARELHLAEHVVVDHDIRTALAGGLLLQPGMALIAGTGSACFGVGANGRTWRAGGWGERIDDAGSGFWLGCAALGAIARAHDGRGPATMLTDLLRNLLELASMDELVHRAGAEGLSRTEIAALAPTVMLAAEHGDAVAESILLAGAEELALMAGATATALDMPDASIVPIGGVAGNARYAGLIRKAIERILPGARIVEPALPPVGGAVLLALQGAGIPITDSLLARVAAGCAAHT